MRRHKKKNTWMKTPIDTRGVITVLARLPDRREGAAIVRVPAGTTATDAQLQEAIGKAMDHVLTETVTGTDCTGWTVRAELGAWDLRFKLSPNLSHFKPPAAL